MAKAARFAAVVGIGLMTLVTGSRGWVAAQGDRAKGSGRFEHVHTLAINR